MTDKRFEYLQQLRKYHQEKVEQYGDDFFLIYGHVKAIEAIDNEIFLSPPDSDVKKAQENFVNPLREKIPGTNLTAYDEGGLE